MTLKPDYGAGSSGRVFVDRTGPTEPEPAHLDVAYKAASGRRTAGLPIPCMDCVPNIVLKDYVCDDCGNWHWGMLIAHDDTCPTNRGLTAPPR